MQILAFSFVDIFRTLFIWIDRLAFGLVDNVYKLISVLVSAEIFSSEMVSKVMKNSYIVIFIFALFRIALLLVNSLVSPEKMTEKGTGLASIAKNIVIMFVLLIVVPILFQESREIQKEIVNEGYIGALFGFNVGGTDAPESAGEVMKKIAISAVLFPDSRFVDNAHTATCSSAKCKEAISEYYTMMDGKYKLNFDMLTHYINVTEEYQGQDVYVYDYSWLISTIVGGFLTYILLSFAIDIAVRTVELAVLEILAPLFIATYIDPKSSKSGPFHNWLTTVGKTYVSLFIKLAIISLALMLISVLVDDAAQQEFNGMGSVGGFAKLLLLVGILIFAKKAPKWITDLIGIKSDDTGLGGITKKLGNAALIGGVASKAMNSAAGIGMGAIRNAHAARKAQKVNMRNDKDKIGSRLKNEYQKGSGNALQKAAHAAKGSFFTKDAAKKNLSNFGKTAAAGALGFTQGVAHGANAGWNSKDLKEVNAATKKDAKATFDTYAPGFTPISGRIGAKISDVHGKGMEAVLGNSFDIQKRKEDAEKDKKALERYGTIHRDSKGKRNSDLSPVNANEVNSLIKNQKFKGRDFDGASVDGISQALIQARLDEGMLKGVTLDPDGKVIYKGQTLTAEEFCKQEKIYTAYGAKEIEAIAKDNAYTQATKYVENQGKISKANQTIADVNTQVLSFQANVKATMGDKALKQIQTFDAVLSGNTTAQQKAITAQQVVATAQKDYNDAVAAGKPAPEIQALQAKLQTATAKLQTAQAVADNEKTTITSMIDRLMGAGTSENYEATVRLRTEAIEESRYLTQENSVIAASVKNNLKEGTASTFHVKDVTTGEEFNFLEKPTEVEHVLELMGRARDKAKDDASKLKPKDKDDKK